MARQIDLICRECPLKVCDETSLWCIFRFVTAPNNAQQLVMSRKKTVKRGKYWSDYYQRNREKKLAQANERNARARAARVNENLVM